METKPPGLEVVEPKETESTLNVDSQMGEFMVEQFRGNQDLKPQTAQLFDLLSGENHV